MSWVTFFRRGHSPRPAIYTRDPAYTIARLIALNGLPVLTPDELEGITEQRVVFESIDSAKLVEGERQCVVMYVAALSMIEDVAKMTRGVR